MEWKNCHDIEKAVCDLKEVPFIDMGFKCYLHILCMTKLC